MSLHDWCLHNGLNPIDGGPFEELFVRQPGTSYEVPLPLWLQAASLHMGGERLLRKQVCVFAWTAENDGRIPTVPPPPSRQQQQPREPVRGAWRSATIVGYDAWSGAFTVKYHHEHRSSHPKLHLPLAIVHFRRLPPPPGTAPRGVAEGLSPVPPVLLPPLPAVPAARAGCVAEAAPEARALHPVLLRELLVQQGGMGSGASPQESQQQLRQPQQEQQWGHQQEHPSRQRHGQEGQERHEGQDGGSWAPAPETQLQPPQASRHQLSPEEQEQQLLAQGLPRPLHPGQLQEPGAQPQLQPQLQPPLPLLRLKSDVEESAPSALPPPRPPSTPRSWPESLPGQTSVVCGWPAADALKGLACIADTDSANSSPMEPASPRAGTPACGTAPVRTITPVPGALAAPALPPPFPPPPSGASMPPLSRLPVTAPGQGGAVASADAATCEVLGPAGAGRHGPASSVVAPAAGAQFPPGFGAAEGSQALNAASSYFGAEAPDAAGPTSEWQGGTGAAVVGPPPSPWELHPALSGPPHNAVAAAAVAIPEPGVSTPPRLFPFSRAAARPCRPGPGPAFNGSGSLLLSGASPYSAVPAAAMRSGGGAATELAVWPPAVQCPPQSLLRQSSGWDVGQAVAMPASLVAWSLAAGGGGGGGGGCGIPEAGAAAGTPLRGLQQEVAFGGVEGGPVFWHHGNGAPSAGATILSGAAAGAAITAPGGMSLVPFRSNHATAPAPAPPLPLGSRPVNGVGGWALAGTSLDAVLETARPPKRARTDLMALPVSVVTPRLPGLDDSALIGGGGESSWDNSPLLPPHDKAGQYDAVWAPPTDLW